VNIGMLWFDNDPKTTLAAKIIRAVTYYTEKYGRAPNLCLINPAMMESPPAPGGASPHPEKNGIGGIAVRPYRPVLPGHLWIGVEVRDEA